MNTRPLIAFCGILLLTASTLTRAADRIEPARVEALDIASSPTSNTLFSRIDADTSGLTYKNSYNDPDMWRRRFADFSGGPVGTGIATGDFDADGLPDLYVVNKTTPNRLYRQTAPFVFGDVTGIAGVGGGDGWSTGATFADVDGDGRLDLFVCQLNAPSLLYHNNGDGTFTERASAAGIATATGSVNGAFADYDRDGDLDFFLLANLGDATRAPEGDPDILFHNNGDGTFSDATAAAGLVTAADRGHSATWFDFNDDGWTDLHVANDFEAPDHLYRNNHDGTFTDVVDEAFPRLPWYAMGADFADINNDGLFDLLVADMAGTTHLKRQTFSLGQGAAAAHMDRMSTPQYALNALYLNTGGGHFLEIAQLAGVDRTDWTWSVLFGDFDNDGWEDLHVTNGMVRDFSNTDLIAKLRRAESPAQTAAVAKRSPVLEEHNLAFRNTGALRFDDTTAAWGLEDFGVSFGAVAVDLDRDGDLDLVHSNFERPVSLYRNNSNANRIAIVLYGKGANRFAVGARLFATTSAGRQSRQLTLSRGTLSSTTAEAHFGLGLDETMQRLEIHWPDGRVQFAENLLTNHRYTFLQPRNGFPGVPTFPKPASLFHDVTAESGIDFANREQPFDEFKAQPLLPVRRNTLGGGLGFGDADGNGDADVYFAGASGQSGSLFLSQGDGTFARDPRAQPWNGNIEAEEITPFWFDANNDGAVDLLVTSGGVEHESGHPALTDRLYFNDGQGAFRTASADEFPATPTSSSAVAAADFDRDGDLDVFIGGSVVAARYPLSNGSRIFENENGVFRSIELEIAPALEKLGRVSAASWSDIDNDGWPDLLVAAEWEPIRLFINRGGHALEDVTARSGFGDHVGWWRTLEAADIDDDGDTDCVAGNVGLNTPYRASVERPVLLYYGDFDESGENQLLEAYEEEGRLLPRRNLAAISEAIPFVRHKYRTAADFGRAPLDEIFILDDALKLSATQLAHGVFLNDGAGHFQFRELPRLAQVAPVSGIAIRDFDGDRTLDLFLVQNDHGPQPTIPRFDGGRGLLLHGRGDGHFDPVPFPQCGVDLPGQSRNIAVADWNRDGRPDVIITRTNARAIALVNRGPNGE